MAEPTQQLTKDGATHLTDDDEQAQQEKMMLVQQELSTGRLLQRGQEMPLFHDRVDGEFCLLDGDSLLMEAASTLGWRPGQQLHLFYIAESLMRLLADHHGGRGSCRVAFVAGVGDAAWHEQPLMRLFRRALRLHLAGSCSVPILAGPRSGQDPSWWDYLARERPLFVLLHGGGDNGGVKSSSHASPATLRQLRLLAYSCLAGGTPIVYGSSLRQVDMRLMGHFVQPGRLSAGLVSAVLAAARKAKKLEEEDEETNDATDEDDGASGCYSALPVPPHGSERRLRDWLAVRMAASLLPLATEAERELASRWCLHFACMSCLTYEDRLQLAAQNGGACADADEAETLESLGRLAKCAAAALKPLELEGLGGFSDPASVADLIDVFVYRQFGARWSGQLPAQHPRAQLVLERYESYSAELRTLQQPPDASSLTLLPLTISDEASLAAPPPPPLPSAASQKQPQLLRIDNRLVNEFAGQLMNKLTGDGALTVVSADDEEAVMAAAAGGDGSSDAELQQRRRLFEERRHWHCLKPLRDDLDEKAEPELSSNPVIRDSQLKSVQKYKTFLQMYGKSLQSEPAETVVVSDGSASPAAAAAADSDGSASSKPASAASTKKQAAGKQQKQQQQQQQQQQKKKKPQPKSRAEQIIEDNLKRKADEEMKKLKERWSNLLPGLRSLPPDQAIAGAAQLVDSCAVQGGSRMFEEPVLFVMSQQYQLWRSSCSAGGKKCYPALAELVHSLHRYSTEPLVSMTSPELRLKIAEYFLMVGFKEAAAVTAQPPDRLKAVQVDRQCVCPMSYRDFQMLHMGHLMKRNIRLDPDPRVKGFVPDTWQRELLDAVDRRESALIVAPTSSGKTFCSYYCMKKVLELNDDAVVVYVAPTKALVNQVQASVTARLTKPNLTPGVELCGVFTRDYAHKATNCQILITVPQCLELLLLSPRRQGWSSRIRYVIFDEVHCLGTGIGGVVWEYLLCTIRCPFLALSATIGNKEFFHDWLQTVKTHIRDQDLTIASASAGSSGAAAKPGKQQLTKKQQQHQQRQQQQQQLQSNGGGASTSYRVNLVSYSERYSDIRTSLYLPSGHDNAATAAAAAGDISEVNACIFLDAKLLRSNGFPKSLNLSPKETHEVWSAAVECFSDDAEATAALAKFQPDAWFGTEPITRTQFRVMEVALKTAISDLLRAAPAAKSAQLLATLRAASAANSPTTMLSLSQVDLVAEFPGLIDRLRAEGRLPALVFMNDRTGIEELATALVAHARANIASSVDPALLLRIERAKQRLADAARRRRDDSDSDGDAADGEKPQQQQSSADFEAYYRDLLTYRSKIHANAYFSPQAVSDSFLADALAKVGDEDVRQMLELGVCYHHAGCGLKHRQTVEMLFRSGYLQVVTATATLALGIHMPCKTVIFAGDDKFLDALNYHQMAGRSGRRGFDNVGNVVLYGIPAAKISHLVQADIPELHGGFPLTCAFVLRLLLLTGNSSDPEAAHAKASAVLAHPFAAHGRPDIMQQLRLYFLFSAEFLRRQGLIDGAGLPQDLAGLVCHIGYHQPGNFVLAHLLRTRAMRALCQPCATARPIHYGHLCKGCRSDDPIVGDRFACQRCWFDFSLCSGCYSSRPDHRRGRESHTKADFKLAEPPVKMQFSDDVLRQLALILCHLFTDMRLLGSLVRRTPAGPVFANPSQATGNSKVLLERLPADIGAAVRWYNERTADTYVNYLGCLAASRVLAFSRRLPLSGAAPLGEDHHEEDAANKSDGCCPLAPLARLSAGTAAEANAALRRALLTAGSGEPLRRLLPFEIFTDARLLPVLPTPDDDEDDSRHLNAYALDFFRHGSLACLVDENGIRVGDLFHVLEDFLLAVRAAATVLEQLAAEPAEDPVVCAFKHLSLEYQARFTKAFPGKKRLPS